MSDVAARTAGRTCSAPRCDRPVEAHGLCQAHRRRRDRGRPLDLPVQRRAAAAFERVVEAAVALADAGDDDDAYQLAKDRTRKAAEAWLRARGWMRLDEAVPLLQAHGWTAPRPDTGPADLDNGSVSRTGS